MQVQWFPGHMLKTKKLIEEHRSKVDLFLEVVDARAPMATSNPLLRSLIGSKPRIVILNKVDLADPMVTADWKRHYESLPNTRAVLISCTDRTNLPSIMKVAEEIVKKKEGPGISRILAMIVGVPNVGKSSLINALSGGRKASVAPKPGHTKSPQRIICGDRLSLLDTPGILWHKFEDPETGITLAMLGSIKDDLLETGILCEKIAIFLFRSYPNAASTYFAYPGPVADDDDARKCLGAWGIRRGMLIKGGDVSWDRICQTLMAEFRAGSICRFSMERP